jgi:hypothetical protein
MRLCTSDTGCGDVLTVIKVRDCLQNVAAGVEGLWPADPTGKVPVRVYDDLCVDEFPGGGSLVQSLTKSGSGRHVYKRFEGTSLVIGRRIYGTYVIQQVRPFPVKASNRGKRTVVWAVWAETACRFLGQDTSGLNSTGYSTSPIRITAIQLFAFDRPFPIGYSPNSLGHDVRCWGATDGYVINATVRPAHILPGPLGRTHLRYQTTHENQRYTPGMNLGPQTTLQTENRTGNPSSQPAWGANGQVGRSLVPGCRAPIRSKGKQRIWGVSYRKRSIETQTAAIQPSRHDRNR